MLVGVLRRNDLHRAGNAPDVHPVAATQFFLPGFAFHLDRLPLGVADFFLELSQVFLVGTKPFRIGAGSGSGRAGVAGRGAGRGSQQATGGLFRLGTLRGTFGLIQLGQQATDAPLQVLAGSFHQFQAGFLYGGQPSLGFGLLDAGLGQQLFRFLAQAGHHRPLFLQFPHQVVGDPLFGGN